MANIEDGLIDVVVGQKKPLSFAEFEREFTAERASAHGALVTHEGHVDGKRSVLWLPSRGSEARDRRRAGRASRLIFARFLEIGSGTELAREVTKRGLRTLRGNRIDKKYLYRLLNNRAYIGEAVHKGDSLLISAEN
jgi:site-specific DNA recombinase